MYRWWGGPHVNKVQANAEKERHQIQKEIQGGKQWDHLFWMLKPRHMKVKYLKLKKKKKIL